MDKVWYDATAERPEPGNRIVQLYDDGSGAFLGFWTGEELIDHDGYEYPWRDDPGSMWAYLPDGFDLWCENRAEDPLTLPANSRARAGQQS